MNMQHDTIGEKKDTERKSDFCVKHCIRDTFTCIAFLPFQIQQFSITTISVPLCVKVALRNFTTNSLEITQNVT